MAGGAEAEVAAVVSKWDSRDLGWALAKAGEGRGRQLRAETREGYGTSSTEEWRRVMGCGPGVTASARRGRRGSGWKGTLGSLPGGGGSQAEALAAATASSSWHQAAAPTMGFEHRPRHGALLLSVESQRSRQLRVHLTSTDLKPRSLVLLAGARDGSSSAPLFFTFYMAVLKGFSIKWM